MHSDPNPAAIVFEDVSKSFGPRAILQHQTFTVDASEIFVVIGPSGSGKSVTLRLASGQLRPDSGTIRILGEDIVSADAKARDALRRRMGYLFQGGALLGWMTLAENVALPLRERGKLSAAEIDRRVTEALAEVGLAEAGSCYPSEVSGGMVKRAAFARAMADAPELLFFDEPTSGLDPVMSRAIDALIVRLNQRLGAACVVVTHDLAGALAYAHRIVFLKDGHFTAPLTPHELLQSEDADIRAFLSAQHPEVSHGRIQ